MNLTGKSFLKWFLVVMIFFIHPLNSFTQTGSIKGKVINKKTKEPLMGAKVFVTGTYMGSLTDENGNFEITNIPQGAYNIKITDIEYDDKIIRGVAIKANEIKVIEIDMSDSVPKKYIRSSGKFSTRN